MEWPTSINAASWLSAPLLVGRGQSLPQDILALSSDLSGYHTPDPGDRLRGPGDAAAPFHCTSMSFSSMIGKAPPIATAS